MHNLATVIKFEIIRTLKKPTFWISVLLTPILVVALGALGAFSQIQAQSQLSDLSDKKINFRITDESKIISPAIIEAIGGKTAPASGKNTAVEEIKAGKLDAYYLVPKNLAEDTVEIYGANSGLAENAKYSSILSAMLKSSSIETVDENKIIALNSTFRTQEVIYKDGELYDPAAGMIAPGIFLVIFYLVILLLSNQMLTSITEEKENRVTEMILTSIKSETLIIGKIISLAILGLIQILILFIPTITGFLLARSYLNIPDITPLLSNIRWEFWPIMVGTITLISGFMMFTGLLVGISAAVPTAKDANNFFSVVILFLMAPFLLSSSFFATTPDIAARVLSIFPLTSPVSLLLRNMLGTLTVHEGVLGISVLTVSAIVTIYLAVRIFRYGTISYGTRVSLKQVFTRK
ncbi:ABC transporter permease [Candidatus Saccharibacteria bacterium]|jgi:ABC-2 type transport system permease protein|nr:ABC transporter permease [Candidatus Saccharibacteria bacterium]NCU43418.1 ABC transporter permease [Candidatus Saccharibacteria bacterium]